MANIFSTILGLFVGTIIYLADRLIALGKWIYSKILNLFRNIVPYFTKRQHKITKDSLVAVSLKIANDIENNNYSELKGILNPGETSGRIVTGIFDKEQGKFIDEDDILVEEYGSLDAKTTSKFGNNDVLIVT